MRKEECMTCAWYYPGAGCRSEEFMACGCCYTPISNSERVTQIIDILDACLKALKFLKLEFRDE